MNNLVKNGHIDHQVFGLFMDLTEGSHTHLKMGGYDSDTLVEGQSLNFLETNMGNNWSLDTSSITVNGTELIRSPRFVDFYPNMPWIYVPHDDFEKLAAIVNQIHKEANPDEKDDLCGVHNCAYQYSCNEVLK